MKQFCCLVHAWNPGRKTRYAAPAMTRIPGPAILDSVERFFEELLSGHVPQQSTPVAEAELDLLPACD